MQRPAIRRRRQKERPLDAQMQMRGCQYSAAVADMHCYRSQSACNLPLEAFGNWPPGNCNKLATLRPTASAQHFSVLGATFGGSQLVFPSG
ncbi:hypothetical protein ACLKA7_016476 [Drosophila subpalustris]